MAKNKTEKSYFDRVHSWGRISSVTALCILLMFPMAICLYLDVSPDIKFILQGLLKLIPTYWTVAVVEVLVYTPMLGAGGTYLSFVTGNIANLKLPCAISAMEGAKVKANSEEGEVISTIAIATSAIVTTIVLAIGIIAFARQLYKESPASARIQDGASRTLRCTRCRLLHQALENFILPDYRYGTCSVSTRYGYNRCKHTALCRYRCFCRRCSRNAQARLA